MKLSALQSEPDEEGCDSSDEDDIKSGLQQETCGSCDDDDDITSEPDEGGCNSSGDDVIMLGPDK